MKALALCAAITLATICGSAATQTPNNAFECFAPVQTRKTALFSWDLRTFTLKLHGETMLLHLNQKSIGAKEDRLVFKRDSIRLELEFSDDDHASGVLSGLTVTDAPVYWHCARQLFGP